MIKLIFLSINFLLVASYTSLLKASKPDYNHILIAFQNPCKSSVSVDMDLNEAGKHSRTLAAGSSDELIFKGVDKRFEMTLKMEGQMSTYNKSEFKHSFPSEPGSHKEITKWTINVGEICAK